MFRMIWNSLSVSCGVRTAVGSSRIRISAPRNMLSMQGAKIYDLDSDPIDVKPWTQLENVKTYYSFFKSHEKEFF